MTKPSRSSWSTNDLMRMGMVATLYVVLTMLSPIAYGPIQFRVSEMMNFLGLYHRRYIVALTLGVFIANFREYGPIDMIVGSASTFVFLTVGRYLAHRLTAKMHGKYQVMAQYAILTIVFSLSMFTIALMIVVVSNGVELFWPVYTSLVLSELVVLTLGAFIVYPLAQKIDFNA